MKVPMTSNLTVKVGSTMIIVVVLAVGLATLLNLLRFHETYERLIAQRLGVAVQEIGQIITVGAGLGLRVEAQGNLPDLLRQHAAIYPDLSAIAVYDCRGLPVVRQGWQDSLGEPWRDHLGQDRWHVFDQGGLTVGQTIRDSLGTCVAGVAVRNSAATYIGVINEVTDRFWAIGAVAAVLAVFAVLAAAFYFDDRRRSLRRLEEDLAGISAGTAPILPPRISMATFGNKWERAMVESYLDARPDLLSRAPTLPAPDDEAKAR